MTVGRLERLDPEIAEKVALGLGELNIANFLGMSLVRARTDESSEGVVTKKWLERSLIQHTNMIEAPAGYLFGVSSKTGSFAMESHVTALSEGVRPEDWEPTADIAYADEVINGLPRVFIAQTIGNAEFYQFQPGVIHAYSPGYTARCELTSDSVVDVYSFDDVVHGLLDATRPVMSMPSSTVSA